MKKVLLVLFVMLFAATSFAAELKLSGGMHVRGQYFDGLDPERDIMDEDASIMYYDQDLNVTADIIADENTKVGLKFAIEDSPWNTNAYNGSAGSDENIQVERAYLMHTFGNGLALTAGRITGGGWAYAFGNNVEGLHRVKLEKKMSDTLSIGGFVQKSGEEFLAAAPADYKDVEKDDADVYAFYAKMNMNGMKILPLVVYSTNGANAGDVTDTVTTLDVAFAGNFGVDVEAEFVYKTGTTESATPEVDIAQMGLWVNVSMGDYGVEVAYASGDEEGTADENTTFSMNDDYEFGLLGNWTLDGLPGLTLVSPYASMGMDAWTYDARLIYAMPSGDDYKSGTAEINSFMEIDGSATYAFSDSFSYTAGLAYLSIDGDTDVLNNNVDAVTRLYHYVAVSF